jgi:hypothetical protein
MADPNKIWCIRPPIYPCKVLFSYQVNWIPDSGMLGEAPLEFATLATLPHELNCHPAISMRLHQNQTFWNRTSAYLRHHTKQIYITHGNPHKATNLADTITVSFYESETSNSFGIEGHADCGSLDVLNAS